MDATPVLPRIGQHSEDRTPGGSAPLATVVGLTAFGAYSIFAAVQGSRLPLTGATALATCRRSTRLTCRACSAGTRRSRLRSWCSGRRSGCALTCYYYRKAYYRSFFWSPPACAVPGPSAEAALPRRDAFPFVLQNAHRFFFYFATIVVGFLWYDAIRSFFFTTSSGSLTFGVGLGSLVLLVNVAALSAFTFGCNSFRHLIGGNLDCFTCSPSTRVRHRLWLGVTVLNVRHANWAWISLATVGLADLYVRLAAAGVFHDPRIF